MAGFVTCDRVLRMERTIDLGLFLGLDRLADSEELVEVLLVLVDVEVLVESGRVINLGTNLDFDGSLDFDRRFRPDCAREVELFGEGCGTALDILLSGDRVLSFGLL